MHKTISMASAVFALMATGVAAQELDLVASMTMPSLGTTPNKYKPHQGSKEQARRRAKQYRNIRRQK